MRTRTRMPKPLSIFDFIDFGQEERTPYCNCEYPEVGFTKRDDHVWVKPCCMRVTQTVWDKQGERPAALTPEEYEAVVERNRLANQERLAELSQRKLAQAHRSGEVFDPLWHITHTQEEA